MPAELRSMFGIKSLADPKVEEELGSPVDLYLEGQDQHRGWLGSEKSMRNCISTGSWSGWRWYCKAAKRCNNVCSEGFSLL